MDVDTTQPPVDKGRAEERLYDIRDWLADDTVAAAFSTKEAYRARALAVINLSIAEMELTKT